MAKDRITALVVWTLAQYMRRCRKLLFSPFWSLTQTKQGFGLLTTQISTQTTNLFTLMEVVPPSFARNSILEWRDLPDESYLKRVGSCEKFHISKKKKMPEDLWPGLVTNPLGNICSVCFPKMVITSMLCIQVLKASIMLQTGLNSLKFWFHS